MADKRSLQIIGLFFATFTVTTMLVAAILVQVNVVGRVGDTATLITAEFTPVR